MSEESMQINVQKMLEPYQKLVENIQKIMEPVQVLQVAPSIMNVTQQIASLNGAIKSKYQWSGITKMLENTLDIASINLDFQDYLKKTETLSRRLLKAYEPVKISEEFIRGAMGITTPISSYRELMTGLENLNNNLSSVATVIYEKSEEEENSELETDFFSNEELHEAMIEQNENPIGFQERVANWTESKKKKYYIAILILMFVWNNFFQPYFQEYIGVPITACTVAHVREFPEKTSKLVINIKEDDEATIIENVPYYYKIIFIDENGEEKEGYVSKRSVKFVEPVIENADMEE